MLTPLMQGAFDLTVKADQPRYFLTVSMLAPTWLQSRFLPVRKNRRLDLAINFFNLTELLAARSCLTSSIRAPRVIGSGANAVQPILDPYLSAK